MTLSNPGVEAAVGADMRVQSLIDITKALDLIFEEENTALEASRPEDAAAFQPEKARLAAAFAQSIRDIAADRIGIGAVDGELLAELRQTTLAFEARAARQKALLDAADTAPQEPA